jgi:hypothetical protein
VDDPREWADDLWQSWCGRQVLLAGLNVGGNVGDVGDQDDGDVVALVAPPPRDETPVTVELAAVIAELAAREQRQGQFLRAWDAGDAATVRSMLPLSTLRDPDRVDGLNLAWAAEHPPPPEPERPFQPPVYAGLSHPLADSHGMVSHGPQFIGESQTTLEKLEAVFREKSALLAQMFALQGQPTAGAAAALGPSWRARMSQLEDKITSLGAQLHLTDDQLAGMDREWTRRARKTFEAQARARQQAQAQVTGHHPGPPRVHAAGLDYLGRQRPEHEPFEKPEQGWITDSKPGTKITKPRRGRQRRARAYRAAAIMARQAR